MIEILLKNKELLQVNNIEELIGKELDFSIFQFIDYTDEELNWAKEKFGLDYTIMARYEDIEISSHFFESEEQASFHFSIPYYNENGQMVEDPVFLLFINQGLFLFSSSGTDNFINETYRHKVQNIMHKVNYTQDFPELKRLFQFQIEFITDYYADITEHVARKIRDLAGKILIDKEFSTNELDVITRYNFNNILIKESLLETTRVFNLYRKSNWERKIGIRESVDNELNDLMAVSDYIQFNFDRLDDLRENVTNKIDLEQNHIFKVLTVVTVCISLPTLVAGIYGMNFTNMPELDHAYGYPLVLGAMILSALLPLAYFRKKKWLKKTYKE